LQEELNYESSATAACDGQPWPIYVTIAFESRKQILQTSRREF